MRKISAAIAAACLIVLQAACGGGGSGASAPSQTQPPQASPTPAPLGPVDPTLAGVWKGTVQGTLGQETMTLELKTDATAQFEGSGRYCAASGNWGVTGTEVTVTGRDCTSTLVTLVAPVSATILDGQWTASSGAHGNFAVSKQ